MTTKEHLAAILQGREDRAAARDGLVKKYRATVISLTLNVPGPDKHPESWSGVFEEGLEAVREALGRKRKAVIFELAARDASGQSALLVADGRAADLKIMAAALEDDHPLGRLWDVDVFDEQGRQLGRETLGAEKRKCVVCGDQAAVCRRSGRHKVKEVAEKMEEIVRNYFKDGKEG
ncbi:MAG: citrate lyase holo-[acyl-carrier protein] synthase [Deltaproteobacteria bacterium]|nr:citrate lyase holo-[acyl-carrier protein] synthase [Deltaproteobacteria bacterium]